MRQYGGCCSDVTVYSVYLVKNIWPHLEEKKESQIFFIKVCFLNDIKKGFHFFNANKEQEYCSFLHLHLFYKNVVVQFFYTYSTVYLTWEHSTVLFPLFLFTQPTCFAPLSPNFSSYNFLHRSLPVLLFSATPMLFSTLLYIPSQKKSFILRDSRTVLQLL